MMTLGQVFSALQALKWSDVVYLERGDVTLKTRVIIADPDDVDPSTELPPGLSSDGWSESICIEDIKSIKNNLEQQGIQADNANLLVGYLHFMTHDAYWKVDG